MVSCRQGERDWVSRIERNRLESRGGSAWNGLAEQIEHGLGFFNDGEDELAATGRGQAGLVGA